MNMRVPYDECLEMVTGVFEKAGLEREIAISQADMMVDAEALGIVSHGLNLIPKYVGCYLAGAINISPEVRVEDKAPSVAVVDGDAGPGPVVMDKAIDIAMEKARVNGISSVVCTNLQHYGAGMHYVWKAVEEGMMIFITANAPANMAPYGGSRKYYGTNPMTFSSPMGSLPPYTLDMASSAIAGNKLENYMRKGEKAPEGIGLDRNGKPSCDPEEIMKYGSLLPFGGAKGSGIAGMINLISGVLVPGAAYEDVISLARSREKPSCYGCMIRVINISSFIDMEEFNSKAENWGSAILLNPPADGFDSVVYPGYREYLRKNDSKRNGIELSEYSIDCLKKGAELSGSEINI